MKIKKIFKKLKNKKLKTININFVFYNKNNLKFEKFIVLPNNLCRNLKIFLFCKDLYIDYFKKIGFKNVFDPNLTKVDFFNNKRTKYILCQQEVYKTFEKKFFFFFNKKKNKISYNLGNIFKNFKYVNLFYNNYISFLIKRSNYINTFFSDTKMCFEKFYENLVFVVNFIKDNFYKIKKIFLSNNNSKSFKLDKNEIIKILK
ncbi:50S ribosomal subunit protein L1 [Candidatus Vidania fulgoroideae]|uniref:50S ribosomal subunit protein L1 n=1 Tax=Candidatus Vidania fulgoroideorum TaxID=881286 RepID=A0A346E0A7_9PROT|nr:50S ribosomal subunit protein L1 [Candidatus Vidania fulgoroideae]